MSTKFDSWLQLLKLPAARVCLLNREPPKGEASLWVPFKHSPKTGIRKTTSKKPVLFGSPLNAPQKKHPPKKGTPKKNETKKRPNGSATGHRRTAWKSPGNCRQMSSVWVPMPRFDSRAPVDESKDEWHAGRGGQVEDGHNLE